ncbi:DUF4097 domain-containing protein, partial [Paenibacillus sepulcri]|nr:DUF4097 domain-containing protein [Paenibacillus sepulcri]
MRNWIIIALILLVVGIIGTGATMGRDGFWNFGTVDIAQNQAVDGTGAKNIILSMESMDVTVVKGPTNEIKASLSGKVSEKFVKSTKLKVVRNGDTVTVGVDAKNGFSFGVSIFNAKLKLELPEQQYDSLALDSGSGNTSITDLAAQTLDVEAGSGNVKFNQLTVGKLSLDIGSGNSTITDVTADTAELDMRSGVITVEKLKARELS